MNLKILLQKYDTYLRSISHTQIIFCNYFISFQLGAYLLISLRMLEIVAKKIARNYDCIDVWVSLIADGEMRVYIKISPHKNILAPKKFIKQPMKLTYFWHI